MTFEERQDLLEMYMDDFYIENAATDVAGTIAIGALTTAATVAVIFGGGVMVMNSAERARFKATAKKWFNLHPDIPSPMKAKPISKNKAIEILKENKVKYKCKNLDLVKRAGGRYLKENDEFIAYSIWIEYYRDKTTKEIELVNFINPKYKKYKAEYCATLAVLSGNCSDSIMAVRDKMKEYNNKHDPKKRDLIDKINKFSDDDSNTDE